jgi:tetratricopeptide (TPR) repeat protein
MRALSEARRLTRDDPIAQARLCHRHADVAQRSEETLTASVRWLKRGLRFVDDLSSPEAVAWRARLRSLLGGIRNRQGRWSDAILACRQAISEAESVGELNALAHAYYALDWALVGSGHPDDATHSSRALAIYQQLGDPAHEFTVLSNLGMFAYFRGLWDEAVSLYRRAGACAERAGRPADLAHIDCNVGEILSDQGLLDEAEAQLQRARRVWTATGEQQGVAFIDMLLARLAMRRGERDGAVPILEAALADLRRFRIDAYADLAEALIAEAEAFAGDAARALEVARRELERANPQRPLLERVAGIALARLGSRDAAVGELVGALRSARDRRSDYDIAATIDVLACLRAADLTLLHERDEILGRLKVRQLPTPVLA